MRILNKIESRERCAEAGWYAYDYLLDHLIDRNFIISLRDLGSFLYLPMLSRPFFKIETDHYLIKGIENDTFFRIAVHGDYVNDLEDVEAYILKIENK